MKHQRLIILFQGIATKHESILPLTRKAPCFEDYTKKQWVYQQDR